MAFSTSNSPSLHSCMPMFEQFRSELDEYHDRRERTIKASRDITAASKKIIFALQRARRVGTPIPRDLHKPKEWEIIRAQYEGISKDLQGINTYRHAHNITGGNQELMEALSFQYYLETQQLISYDEAAKRFADLSSGDHHVFLSSSDYLLGVFDMVGELMRFAITTMMGGQIVTTSKLSDGSSVQRSVLSDMRELRSFLENLDVSGSSLARDVGKKMGVMLECVEKVEKASYGQIVRGSERPKGWIPDLDDRGRAEVEAV